MYTETFGIVFFCEGRLSTAPALSEVLSSLARECSLRAIRCCEDRSESGSADRKTLFQERFDKNTYFPKPIQQKTPAL